MRRTRIVATLGPATNSLAALRRLVQAGVDVVRLNFSHGSREFHADAFAKVRRVSRELKTPVAILQDLRGPKMRVGRLRDDAVRLRVGHGVRVIEGSGLGNDECLFVEAAGAVSHLSKGDVIRLADGLLELRVTSSDSGGVGCEVVSGGVIRTRQGVNIPGADLGVKALTTKDRRDLKFGLELGVDAVALSFVSNAADVYSLRRLIERHGASPFVVAKIERQEAMANLEEIVDAAHGIMVARGDLGVEIGYEKVPGAQKRIIKLSNEASKPVITATQMLESMIERPSATRAEVSDIATAVMEGTDALMLSGETAVGAFPVDAVGTLDTVAVEVEGSMLANRRNRRVEAGSSDIPHAVSRAARSVARSIGAAALVVFTETGSTARLVSSQRPGLPCFGFTPSESAARRMRLFWGLRPMLMASHHLVIDMVAEAEATLYDQGFVERGDKLVIVCGERTVSGATNTLLVHEVAGRRRRRATRK